MSDISFELAWRFHDGSPFVLLLMIGAIYDIFQRDLISRIINRRLGKVTHD